MQPTHLNEHDANQGAQSSGEFLGMTGNSGWYLLGSGGATILIVVLLWGIFGVSLLLCLVAGSVLCGLSIAYVFALKNNRPAHYDTDYFESALVEAGVRQFCFGPRARRPVSPFVGAEGCEVPELSDRERASFRPASMAGRTRGHTPGAAAAANLRCNVEPQSDGLRAEGGPMVSRVAYDQLEEKLSSTQEMLEDALAEHAEE
jgi:hypothetical protein